jgi:2-hydroxy-3-keto-5-methylthiopentenyl-1-phosphate phosphatase
MNCILQESNQILHIFRKANALHKSKEIHVPVVFSGTDNLVYTLAELWNLREISLA